MTAIQCTWTLSRTYTVLGAMHAYSTRPSAQVLATQDTSEPSDFEDGPVIFACIPNTQITREPFQINSTRLKIMKIYIEDFRTHANRL